MPTSTLRHPWRRRGWTQPDSLTAAGRVGGAKASPYLPAPLARQANMQGCKWQEEVFVAGLAWPPLYSGGSVPRGRYKAKLGGG